MIFVCTGTQVYQFDRLLKELDSLVSKGIVEDEIFAQIGSSTYIPQFYKYEKFISADKFTEYLDKSDLVISHGGTGALINASKKGKNIVAVPRLKEFEEHIDDHQLQIVGVLEKEGYIRAVYDISDLGKVVSEALINPIAKPYNRESKVLDIIEAFIDGSI